MTDVNIQERDVDFALDSHGCQGSLVRENLLRPARVTESTLAGACSTWLLVPALSPQASRFPSLGLRATIKNGWITSKIPSSTTGL